MANIIEYLGKHRLFNDPKATKLGFQLDQNAEEKLFKFPRHLDGFDLSQFSCFLLLSGPGWTDRVELSQESCDEETLFYRWTVSALATSSGKPVIFQPVFQNASVVLHLDKDVFTICSSVDTDREIEVYYPDYISKLEEKADATDLKALRDEVKTFSNPNYILNANSQIWQRGLEFTLIQGSSSWVYCEDRWRYKFTGTAGSSAVISRNTDGGVKITITGTGTVTRQQPLEHSFTGTLTSCIDNQKIVAPFSGSIVEQTFSKTSTVQWTKLETGGVSTLFQPQIPSEILATCQTFYQTISDIHIMMRNCSTASGANTYEVPVTFHMMRRKPTSTFTPKTFTGTSSRNFVSTGWSSGYVSFTASGASVTILGDLTLDAEIY